MASGYCGALRTPADGPRAPVLLDRIGGRLAPAPLRADVKVDGRIHVDGRGLLLGGGNAVGLNGNASVFATLICEAVAPFTERSTNGAGVALEPNGDFQIDDVLVPAPPADCESPVLLIRNSEPNPVWFAAGIPKQD